MMLFFTLCICACILFILCIYLIYKLFTSYSRENNLLKSQYELEKIVDPLVKTLSSMEENVNKINDKRQEEYIKLSEQIKFLLESNKCLQNETNKLSQMLKNPQMRGRWGEMQLKNIIESTGMNNYTSFEEQITLKDDDGIFRPDLVIRIPGERKIIIDAKTPFNSYLEAYESNDEKIYKMKMEDHIKALKSHIKQLGQKRYWEKISSSPPFVIMFLPAESFLSTSMYYDKSLLDYADSYNVVLMTPSLLLSMLRIIAHGWQQEKLYQNNEEIAKIGGELYKKLQEVILSFSKLGNSLDSMVNNYNKLLSSVESRLMVLSKKLHDLGISKENSNVVLKEVDSKVKKS